MKVIKEKNKIVIENLKLEVFKILWKELGYAYCKKSGREYFLKEVYPNYLVRETYQMKDDLIDYIKNNFTSLNINNDITIEDVLNVIYDKRPVTKVYARSYLSFNSRVSENEFVIEEDKFIRI